MPQNAFICDLHALAGGDTAVFEQVYDHYAEQVYKLAFLFVKDNGWSEDIVQEVFVRLWKHREKLDVAGNIWLFLYVLTKRQALNKLREIRHTQTSLERLYLRLESQEPMCPNDLEVSELEQHIFKAMQSLPPKQQLVFKMSRIDGLSHSEIAQKLQISQHTVKNHIVEALKSLREQLNKTDYRYLLILTMYIF